MTISCIMAVDNIGGIAKNGTLPWNYPKDMQFFKKTTMGSTVIMGMNTFKTLSKPLPGRINIVLTRGPIGVGNDVQFMNFKMVEDMLKNNSKDIFIIGGKELLKLTIKYCTTLYLTTFTQNHDCDLFIENLFDNFIFKELLYIDDDMKIECFNICNN